LVSALAGLAAEGFQTIEGDAREVSVIDAAQPETAEVVVIDVQDPEMTYRVASRFRGRARDLRIVTWVTDRDPWLDALDVEMHTVGAATAVALEGAVLHPGLFSVLGSGGESGLEEVTVRNVAVAEVPLHGGVRVVLVLRDGEVIVPEGDTTLMLHDRVTLGGEPPGVREAFYFLRGHRVEPRD
jgi:Trk K+ transport system NAD-binding subunit